MNLYLIKACREGNINQAKLLLKAGADPNQFNRYEDTPLHEASSNDYLEIVELLLKSGADPNRTDNNGDTPLIWAMCVGCLEIVELLLKAGTTPTSPIIVEKLPYIGWYTTAIQK